MFIKTDLLINRTTLIRMASQVFMDSKRTTEINIEDYSGKRYNITYRGPRNDISHIRLNMSLNYYFDGEKRIPIRSK